jgi:hypothetical protein
MRRSVIWFTDRFGMLRQRRRAATRGGGLRESENFSSPDPGTASFFLFLAIQYRNFTGPRFLEGLREHREDRVVRRRDDQFERVGWVVQKKAPTRSLTMLR